MRMRRKPNLKARMERCAHLLIAEPGLLRGRWLCLAEDRSRGGDLLPALGIDELGRGGLHVELGCGKGRFTVETAKAEAGVFIVALEKTADVMIIALERAAAESLKNVRFVNAFADDLLDYFAPGEVSRIYLNFCDPWPSNRHVKRRLTHRRFLNLYSQVLKPGGEIHFKTDNLPLFEYSLQEFELAGFTLNEVTRDLHQDGPVGVMTDYEQKFHGQGQPICRCVARK